MRDVAPTGVRIAPELKTQLMREATINGRTLHAEILLRLQQSLSGKQPLPPLHTSLNAPLLDAVQKGGDGPAGEDLTELDRSMLGVFRKLPVEKQLALLSLFK